jgi:hypothetical protein
MNNEIFTNSVGIYFYPLMMILNEWVFDARLIEQ